MASKLAVFDWHYCSLTVPKPGGRGSGCNGLVKLKEGVVWRGQNGVMEMIKVPEGSWERYADGDGVGKATLVAHRNKLLAVGGLETTNVRKLRIKKNKIHPCASKIPDMSIGCSMSCVVSIEESLVVMGGCGASGILDTVQLYSHVAKAWSLVRALPTPCACGSAIVYQDSIILLGGNHMATLVWCAKISEILVGHFVSSQSYCMGWNFFMYMDPTSVWDGVCSITVCVGRECC